MCYTIIAFKVRTILGDYKSDPNSCGYNGI